MKAGAKILLIDVGNTRSTLGWIVDGEQEEITLLDSIPKETVLTEEFPGQVKELIRRENIDAAAIASVVPVITSRWIDSFTGLDLPFLHLTHETDIGIHLNYPKPETLGPDRLANAVGAKEKYGTPVAVADFGTALTFDVVDSKGDYVGGIIEPGLPLMFQYLAEKTALLPELTPGDVPKEIGKSTSEGMQLGAWLGYRGMVRETFSHLEKEFGADLVRVGTGGYHQWVLNGFDPPVISDHTLTLHGLMKIYQRNRETL